MPRRPLIASTLANSVIARRSIAQAEQYLLSQRANLARFDSVESFALADPSERTRADLACAHHLIQIRAALARELWGREVFIGITVLDDLLFREFARGTSASPIRSVVEFIRERGLHSHGLLIYPLHSIGVLGAGLLHWATSSRIELALPEVGVLVAPQTNDLSATFRLLERARATLDVSRRLPMDLLRHWIRTAPIAWLTTNPLLVARVRSFPGNYYENQSLLLVRIRTATAMIAMIASLQESADPNRETFWNSSYVNNYSTLDIAHYIVLYPHPRKRTELAGDCVPMNVRPASLAELSDLNVTMDPRFLRRHSRLCVRVCVAVQAVQNGYLRNSFGANAESTRARVYRKLYDSLLFFHRSLKTSEDKWAPTVNLAVAFEMLLTDHYDGRPNATIVKRLRRALRGVNGVRAFAKAIDSLYKARNAFVHAGHADLDPDIAIARRAFVELFVVLAERAHLVRERSATPFEDMIG